jgi:hypothetical protein
MKSRAETRVWWLLATLAGLCLQAAPGLAQSARLVFHLARFEYVVPPSKCEDPTNPVLKLIKSARGDAAELQAHLASQFPDDECAQRIRAEIMLATDVVDYLQSQGIGVIFHLDKAVDLEQQLAKVKAPTDAQFLLHCVFTLNGSNANQLEVMCTIKRLNGDCVGAKSWSHPNPPLDKLVDRFNEDVSQKITTLCKNQMPTGPQGQH